MWHRSAAQGPLNPCLQAGPCSKARSQEQKSFKTHRKQLPPNPSLASLKKITEPASSLWLSPSTRALPTAVLLLRLPMKRGKLNSISAAPNDQVYEELIVSRRYETAVGVMR